MPAAQALGCSACGRAITPCLVCAFPIPVATSEREIFGSKSCGKCGVLNPVGVKNRFLLGFPPALALPPAVVRRAQVARVGRMAYTLAKHAHYVHLRALLQGRKEFDIQEEEEEAGEEPLAIEETDSIDTAHPTSFEDLDLESSNPSVPEVYASPQEGLPLRFLPYLQDWRLQEGGFWKSVMAMEACRCNPLPDSEPPSKRFKQSVDCRNLKRPVGQQLQIDEAGMKPGVKRSCCSEDLKQLRHGDDKIVENEKTAAVTALSGHEGLQQKRQKTSHGEESEELARCSAKKSVQVEQGNSKHDYPSVCDECGQSGEISGTSWQQVDEAGLVQCCSQLLELHCPHSFNADSNNNTTYPLCVASHRSIPEANTQKSVYGDCQSYATQFTIDLLQAAHSAISTLYQASHESQNSQESPGDAYWSDARVVQQALAAAKHFLSNHKRVASLQSLVMQAEAASSWAEKDFKAFSHQGVFPLANAIVVGLLQERKQLKLQTVEKDVDEMAMLLLQINSVLRFCFQRVMEDLQTAQISIHLNQGKERVKVVSEAVRTAVPLWLRLYHDIAHCTGLLNQHHH